MMRVVLSLVSFVVATLVASVLAVLSGPFSPRGDAVLALGRIWGRLVLAVSGVQMEVSQRTPLDPHRPYVFMANHASMIDIFAMFVALPVPFRFIAKKQLGRIPIFGWAMWAGRYIFIDRQNAVAARRSIEEAARRIKGGQSVVIYPEGTRTRDGRLGSFKKGGFHLAIDSGVDIVPVAIHGSRALMPRGAMLIRGGKIKLEIDTPISTAGLGPADRSALVERVHARIAEMLGEPMGAQEEAASGSH